MTALRLAIVGVGDVAQRDYLPEFGRLAQSATIPPTCDGDLRGARVRTSLAPTNDDSSD